MKTKIEWTDYSWNPIRAMNKATGKKGFYCEHVTTGCEFCYAEGMNKRLGTGLPFKPGHRKDVEIFLDEKMLLAPLHWRKPRMIFVCSMTDAFASFVRDEWLDKMLAVMALTPQHTYQLLTKRPERMLEYFNNLANTCARDDRIASLTRHLSNYDDTCLKTRWPLRNCWLGTSVERQQEADERIPHLLRTPAAVRFLSCEPLLGHILVKPEMMLAIDWVIVGSESGPKARACDLDWVRSLCGQCSAAGVAFFWKQHATNGRKIPTPELDGRKWTDFPQTIAYS